MDTPVFLLKKGRMTDSEFVKSTKADIVETLKFLYKRGMFSKYHYTFWTKEANAIQDEELLHAWWDAITQGAMFEVEGTVEARMEALEEFAEDEVEQERLGKRRTKKMKDTEK